jgi:hypothetical protein
MISSSMTVWIVALAGLNALALLVAAILVFAGPRAPRTVRERENERTATTSSSEQPAIDLALRELVGEVERIEAAHTGGPRGEARLAAEIGRWRARRGNGRGWPRAAEPCRSRTAADSPASQG